MREKAAGQERPLGVAAELKSEDEQDGGSGKCKGPEAGTRYVSGPERRPRWKKRGKEGRR